MSDLQPVIKLSKLVELRGEMGPPTLHLLIRGKSVHKTQLTSEIMQGEAWAKEWITKSKARIERAIKEDTQELAAINEVIASLKPKGKG